MLVQTLHYQAVDLRYLAVSDWPDAAQDAAYLVMTSPARTMVLERLRESDGPIMAREWLARRVEKMLDFNIGIKDM